MIKRSREVLCNRGCRVSGGEFAVQACHNAFFGSLDFRKGRSRAKPKPMIIILGEIGLQQGHPNQHHE
ncbi:hypothetical protein CDV31_013144 [Fusarium ambrosium]|uniref:Uncharacterized protein n=1 Tax=Fusarium ambrosium TaxID=131363 RepID=A0A428T595_9HYPO|nr:hypothetical protein CDV31_013144 [Fusarium ambrosium]